MTSASATENPSNTADENDSIDEQVEQLRGVMGKMVEAGNGKEAIEALLEVIVAQHDEKNRLLQVMRRNEARARALFGRRSEKLTAEELGQLALAFGASEDEAAQPDPKVPAPQADEETADKDGDEPDGDKKKRRKKGSKKGRHCGRSRLDPALPRTITVHCVPACERNCIHCGTFMESVGHLDHERIEYIPARIEVFVDRREKLACKKCGQDIVIAPRPEGAAATTASGAASTDVAQTGAEGHDVAKAANGSQTSSPRGITGETLAPGAHVYRRAGTSLLAHMLEAKADDALPVYRQREQLGRLGFDVPLNTLYTYWKAAADLIQPVAQVVLSTVLGDDIVGVDDTRLDWLDPEQKGRRKRGHLWCFTGTTKLVAFEFTKTWCAEDVAPWIQAIDGFIQCDDYKGYSSLLANADGVEAPLVPPEKRLGCWMHIRRRFHKAFKSGEKHAIIALGHIKKIYEVEATATERGLGPKERHALRQKHSKPQADAFFLWVEGLQKSTRPSSYLGQATRYAVDQKPFAMRCFADGRFELDTGRVERQIREPVIGRKNFLFSGSAEAAQRLAGVYTLVCSCHNLGINTRDYLIDVMDKLQAGFPLRDINQLRPDIWAAARSTLLAHQLREQASQQTAETS